MNKASTWATLVTCSGQSFPGGHVRCVDINCVAPPRLPCQRPLTSISISPARYVCPIARAAHVHVRRTLDCLRQGKGPSTCICAQPPVAPRSCPALGGEHERALGLRTKPRRIAAARPEPEPPKAEVHDGHGLPEPCQDAPGAPARERAPIQQRTPRAGDQRGRRARWTREHRGRARAPAAPARGDDAGSALQVRAPACEPTPGGHCVARRGCKTAVGAAAVWGRGAAGPEAHRCDVSTCGCHCGYSRILRVTSHFLQVEAGDAKLLLL
ncbi:hypothetical protein B0H21DRAFT_885195 [Amylocystis lapponica]|nr:hypothetical protein B0H21DRAFT_885195 [Amylocystis lapponica]